MDDMKAQLPVIHHPTYGRYMAVSTQMQTLVACENKYAQAHLCEHTLTLFFLGCYIFFLSPHCFVPFTWHQTLLLSPNLLPYSSASPLLLAIPQRDQPKDQFTSLFSLLQSIIGFRGSEGICKGVELKKKKTPPPPPPS